MLRFIIPTLALALALPISSQAASLKDFELNKTLQKVAEESSKGTPRAINEDILDQGYTVDGIVLINHLSVRPQLAAQMRSDPQAAVPQLGRSVCSNEGYRKLMAKGAILRYDFSEYQTNRPVLSQSFQAENCQRRK